MALDVRRTKEQFKVEIEELRQFDNMLKDAYDKPWWRLFIVNIQLRRQAFLQSLVESTGESRYEDRLRGEINGLTFILALDQRAESLSQGEEDEP